MTCLNATKHTITRTSGWVITLWRSCELLLCFWIFHESKGRAKYIHIKNNEHDLHIVISTDYHELVLVFMTYYYWFYIDFNDLCVQLRVRSFVVKQQYHKDTTLIPKHTIEVQIYLVMTEILICYKYTNFLG